MIKKTFEIDLSGIELYAVQEIEVDGNNITPKSIVARNTYAEARECVEKEIETAKRLFGENNVKIMCDRLKDKYTLKVSYANEIAKGEITVIYAISKLFL